MYIFSLLSAPVYKESEFFNEKMPPCQGKKDSETILFDTIPISNIELDNFDLV